MVSKIITPQIDYNQTCYRVDGNPVLGSGSERLQISQIQFERRKSRVDPVGLASGNPDSKFVFGAILFGYKEIGPGRVSQTQDRSGSSRFS